MSYRLALAIRPEFAEALDNLGVAPHETGSLDDAIASYRQAIKLESDWAETLGNLAIALEEHGEPDEALVICLRALQLQETAGTRGAFVQCIKRVNLHRDSHEIRTLLTRAVSEPWARPGDLVDTAFSLIMLNQDVRACVERAKNAWPNSLTAHELFGESGFTAVTDDMLLRALLENTTVNNLALKHFLTQARHVMLDCPGQRRAWTPLHRFGPHILQRHR